MRLFLWKDVKHVWNNHPGGVLVFADDLTHAYGLMTKHSDMQKDCEVFNSRPLFVTDIPRIEPNVILFPDTGRIE